jgi:hypothetical protein
MGVPARCGKGRARAVLGRRRKWYSRSVATSAGQTNAVRLAFARAARLHDPAAVDTARKDVLVSAVRERDDDVAIALVDTVYRGGEIGEQVSVLKALPHLPDPKRFVPLAVEACRTNAEPVFRAIAIDNALPAAHFPDLAFRQMVLKAIFLGVAVEGIVGLEKRVDDELVRMVESYASERRAAGRPVPADVDAIVALRKAAP